MRRLLIRSALGSALVFAVAPVPAHAHDEPLQLPEPTPASVPAAPEPAPVAADTAAAPEPAPSPAPDPAAPAPAVDEVTVAGTKLSRMPGSAHVITRRQLERMEYDDAQAVLRQVPGVYIRQEDGIGLRPNIGFRGANPDRSKKITLMEDGILFGPAPYSAPAAYYFPLMTRMTAVRVVKGPSAVAYGPQTVGGAIDFVSRPIPDRTTGYLDVAVGQYGYGKLHAYVGTSNEQMGFLLEGVHLQDGGFKELPNGGDTGSTRNDLMTKVSYVVDPSASQLHKFGLKVSYADETSNETYLGLTDADFRADPYQRYAASSLDQMNNHRIAFAATHRFEVPALALTVKTDVYRHDYERIWRKLNHFEGADIASVLADPTDPVNAPYLSVLKGQRDTSTPDETLLIGPNDRSFVSEGVQQVVSLGVDKGPVSQRLEFGFRLHHDEIDRLHTESPYSMIGGELVPQDAPVRVTTANVATSDALALHVIDAVTIGGLTATPGVRVEIIRSSLEEQANASTSGALVHAVMPGFGLYYSLTDHLGVLAGAYRGFSPPPPGSPESTTKPEYSVNYEAGARFGDGPLRGELIGFYNDYSNLTDVCTLASGCLDANLDRQFDAGRAHIYGLEAYAAHNVPLTEKLKLPVTVAYTFTRAAFEETFESQEPIYGSVVAGDQMPYVPRHLLSATFGVEHPRAGGAVVVNYVSPMREEAGSEPLDQTVATDEQLVVDFSASVKLLRFLSLYGNLRNVFGGEFIVSRRPFGARPNPPRWLQLGAKLSF